MAEDWRKKYLQLADESEREQKAAVEGERQLVRLITRLCVATAGLDPLLDPHIDRLREAAKGSKSTMLMNQAGPIGEALVQAADERTQPGALQRLLERGSLGRRELNEVVKLWGAVATDPGGAADEQLDRLGELLQKGLPESSAAAEKPGLLARLIHKGGDNRTDGPNQRLIAVLKAISWPESAVAEVAEFETLLSSDEGGEAWVEVVQQISDLAVRALDEAQHNAEAAERFLTDLNQQLEELDRHMLSEADRRDQSRASGERLGESMSTEVGTLSASVRESANLAELQSSVLGSLERMHSHVKTHLHDENSRRELAESESEALREQMRQLELEAFDLRRLVAQTQQQAMCDPLTGLPNRRAYDERIAQEFARWRRFGEPLALLVWDIDDFKQVNDTFGHKAGDRVLVMVGKLLRERLRETDFIARFGGEELVVLLVGAGPEDASRLAKGMCEAIENGGLHAHGKPVRVTVSGGLRLFVEGDTPEKAFELADAALYKAKHQGKNQVVVG